MAWDSGISKYVLWNALPYWVPGLYFYSGFQIVDEAGHLQQVVVAGTSNGSTEPTWNDSGGVTVDGSVHWQDEGLASPQPLYTFDPATLTCSPIAFTANVPLRLTGTQTGIWGRLSYVPAIGASVLAADTNVDADVICMQGGGCNLSFPPPPTVTNGFSIGGTSKIGGTSTAK